MNDSDSSIEFSVSEIESTVNARSRAAQNCDGCDGCGNSGCGECSGGDDKIIYV